jgi:hypothetical protein
MMNKYLVKIVSVLMHSILWSGVIFLLTLILHTRAKGISLQDMMTGIGLVFMGVGLFTYVSGNPMGVFNASGTNDSNLVTGFNMMVTAEERKSTEHIKYFTKQNVLSFENGKVGIIFGGLINLLISILCLLRLINYILIIKCSLKKVLCNFS